MAINEVGGLPAGYKLKWSDEFDSTGAPDPRRWRFDTSRNLAGWYNNEKQYYANNRQQNSRVEGGYLVIEARKEVLNRTEFLDWGGQAYTSAKLDTKGRMSFTYGFVEARAKLPCARGSWSAIWTLPDLPAPIWPNDGEIDIMEHLGWDAGMVYQTIHTRNYNHTKSTQKSVWNKISDTCGKFHLYQMTWTKEYIVLGIDNENYFRFSNDGTSNYGTWPFNNPNFLILNLAVGGDWGGKLGIDDASFPWVMQVDYVRLYQKL